MSKTSELYQHARREFLRRGLIGKSEPLPSTMAGIVLTVVDAYDDHRSRHRSVNGVIDLIYDMMIRLPVSSMNKDLDVMAIENMARLMSFLPLSPLTGEDAEWNYHSPGVERNKRCPRVLRDAEKVAYDTKAPQPDGTTMRVIVDFPYLPKRKA